MWSTQSKCFPVAQSLKRLPPMRETRVWSLGWEDPLEKEMVTHSSILAWRISWMEKPGRLQSTGLQRVRHDWATKLNWTETFDCVDHNKLWKILQEMGIPDHLICLRRNLYAGQEATVRTGHGTKDWFQIIKGLCQGCILSPCLFNLYTEYIMRNARLDEAQAGIKIARRNINTSDMQMTPPPPWQKVKNWRASWWKWKRRVKKLA